MQERGETEIQGPQKSGVVTTITHNALYSTGVQCTVQESGVVNTITHNALPYLDKLNKIVRDSMHHLIASGSDQCGRSVPW